MAIYQQKGFSLEFEELVIGGMWGPVGLREPSLPVGRRRNPEETDCPWRLVEWLDLTMGIDGFLELGLSWIVEWKMMEHGLIWLGMV